MIDAPTREQSPQELQDGVLSDNEIPKDGIVITIDSQKIGYWQLGNIPEEVGECGLALYRLLSYYSGNGMKIKRAVEGITGRNN